MPLTAAELAVDKCFVTAGGQVRRILELDGDSVTYESRGKKSRPKSAIWGPKVTATVDKFYMFRAIFHPVRRYSLAGGLVLMCRKLV